MQSPAARSEICLCSLQVQRQPGHVDAWRLLGTVHAENDDDTQAIAAMGHALKADPLNSEVCSPQNFESVSFEEMDVYANMLPCSLSQGYSVTNSLPNPATTKIRSLPLEGLLQHSDGSIQQTPIGVPHTWLQRNPVLTQQTPCYVVIPSSAKHC